MGLVVQHNITALNANRQLGVTSNAQAKSTEKLSSGYKINRAGDDAAGLTISEKMRSQIRGLDKASTNAQDGISLIQSAEGALNEAHSILQRMNELAVQGANDTNEGIDRDAINEELAALTEELDRIATTTQFNKQDLLDGSFKGKNLQIGANNGQTLSISIDAMNASALGIDSYKVDLKVADEDSVALSIRYTKGNLDAGASYNTSITLSENLSVVMEDINIKLSAWTSTDLKEGVDYLQKWDGSTQKYITLDKDGKSLAKYDTIGSALPDIISKRQNEISAELYTNKQDYVTASTWAITKNNGNTMVNGARVDDAETAGRTISIVQNAINVVSKQRSALGALQNRLEHTVANLDTVSENTSAAESRIRDTDMAKEMVNYSKNNILAQAGQSMLAQANQSTQGVLSLLQ